MSIYAGSYLSNSVSCRSLFIPFFSASVCPHTLDILCLTIHHYHCHRVPAEDAIKQLFHFPGMSAFTLPHLAVFFLAYTALASVAYGIAVPSGLFIPSLLSGAAMGRFVGTLAGQSCVVCACAIVVRFS